MYASWKHMALALLAGVAIAATDAGAQSQDPAGAIAGMMGNSEPDGTSLGLSISPDSGIAVDSSTNAGGWKGGELDAGATVSDRGVDVDVDGTMAQGYAAGVAAGASAGRDGIAVQSGAMVDPDRIRDGLETGSIGLDGLGLDLRDLGIAIGSERAGAAGNALANLSEGEARQLTRRCGDILSEPSAFDRDLVALCRMLRSR